jgi:TolB-like protein
MRERKARGDRWFKGLFHKIKEVVIGKKKQRGIRIWGTSIDAYKERYAKYRPEIFENGIDYIKINWRIFMKRFWLLATFLPAMLIVACSTTVAFKVLDRETGAFVPEYTLNIDGKTLRPGETVSLSTADWATFKARVHANGYRVGEHTLNKKLYAGRLVVGLLIFLPELGWCYGPAQEQTIYLIKEGANSETSQRTSRTQGVTTSMESAINKACDTLIAELPRRSTVAVLSVSARDRDMASFTVDEIEFQLVDSREFNMVDRKTLDSIRSEQNFQMSGEVSDASAVSIGNMLGANIVITGSITGTGNTQRLTVKALDVKTAEIVVMAREQF